MPSITTRGAASSAAFGLAQSQTLRTYNYWIAELGGAYPGGGASTSDVALDSSGNVYVFGGSGFPGAYVAKYNTAGIIQWNQYFPAGNLNGIAVDSSGNVYVTGYTSVGANQDVLIAKFNSIGIIQWQRTIGRNVSSPSEYGYGVAVDSSGNAYVTGYAENASGSGTYDIFVFKYDYSVWYLKII